MSRRILLRISILVIMLLLVAFSAPIVAAQGPVPSGTYTAYYYNFVSNEEGAACPAYTAAATASETSILHFWPEWTAPASGVAVNNYTACWVGSINFPSSGNWTVNAIHDDGMDVWVNGTIMMRQWYDTGPSYHSGTLWINAGWNQVLIKYYNRNLGGTACVGWSLEGYSANWSGYCPSQQVVYTPYTNPTYYYPYNYTQTYPQTYPGYTTSQAYYPYYPSYPNYGTYPQNGQYYSPYTTYYPQNVSNTYGCYYTVVKGDTLGAIAARYGTTAAVLAQNNGIPNASLIYQGTLLRVPCPQ